MAAAGASAAAILNLRCPLEQQNVLRLDPTRLHALRMRSLARALASHTAAGWGRAAGEAAGAAGGRRLLGAAPQRGGGGSGSQFGSVAVPAMYRKNNPYDFRVVPEDGEELPSVSNLERSIDEMDEQR